MSDAYFEFQLEMRRAQARSGRGGQRLDDGFRCGHCRVYVSAEPILSGVNNRNHCPYCLWSRHLDLVTAGDRLCACKALMRPIGLTLKKMRPKYGLEKPGELMLIHQCVECGRPSLNRLAADDDVERVLEIYAGWAELDASTRNRLGYDGIRVLEAADEEIVFARLLGR